MSLEVDVTFSNLVIMDGSALAKYLVIQGMVIFNMILMALDCLRTVRKSWEEFNHIYNPWHKKCTPKDGGEELPPDDDSNHTSLALLPLDAVRGWSELKGQ